MAAEEGSVGDGRVGRTGVPTKHSDTYYLSGLASLGRKS